MMRRRARTRRGIGLGCWVGVAIRTAPMATSAATTVPVIASSSHSTIRAVYAHPRRERADLVA